MPFVKLDTGILNSTLWMDRSARELFITALLMAEPFEAREPLEQIKIGSLESTGFIVPPGWYGFVHAASVGIINRAGMDRETGMAALEILGSPEDGSRSRDFEGRRLVRVDGGFIVLNFMKYRDRDYTSAERSRRYRERRKMLLATRDASHQTRDITQADSRVQSTEALDSKATPVPHPLQFAAKLAEMIGMPQTHVNLRTIAEAIKAEAKYTGREMDAVTEYLAAKVMDARDQGISIDKFYFEDTKWRQDNGKSERISPARARDERVKRNILDGLTEAARRRDAAVQPELKVGARKRISD